MVIIFSPVTKCLLPLISTLASGSVGIASIFKSSTSLPTSNVYSVFVLLNIGEIFLPGTAKLFNVASLFSER